MRTQHNIKELINEDMEMAAQVPNHNIETFASQKNVWRTEHFRVEEALETELER